jgi:hypothetical protein
VRHRGVGFGVKRGHMVQRQFLSPASDGGGSLAIRFQAEPSVVQDRPFLVPLGAEAVAQHRIYSVWRGELSGRVVLPDDVIYRQRSLGAVPAVPATLATTLAELCPLTDDGRTVGETHRLIFLPSTIDGIPTSVASLRDFALDVGGPGKMVCFDQKWYDREPFARTPLPLGRWILLYGAPAPGTLALNDDEQVAFVKRLGRYRTASVIETVGVIVMQALQNGERLFERTMVRCEECSSAGARIAVGLFDERGFGLSDSFDDYRLPFLGRALVRKL